MLAKLRAMWNDEEGVAAVEYCFLLAVVAVASAAAWNGLSDVVGNMVVDASNQIANNGN